MTSTEVAYFNGWDEMAKRRRRQRQQGREGIAATGWLTTPILLAFSAGIIAGFVLGLISIVIPLIGLAAVVFVLAFTMSHLLGRRLRSRRAAPARPPGASPQPPASSRAPHEG